CRTSHVSRMGIKNHLMCNKIEKEIQGIQMKKAKKEAFFPGPLSSNSLVFSIFAAIHLVRV
ncbi:MAG: hypothetical protein WBL21_02385, partial [Salinimicrobium sp.]